MALLDSGNKILKELKFEDEHPLAAKREYVDSQITAIRGQLFRERVDMAISENIETISEEQKDALQTKAREQRNNIKNYVRALKVLNKMKAEL